MSSHVEISGNGLWCSKFTTTLTQCLSTRLFPCDWNLFTFPTRRHLWHVKTVRGSSFSQSGHACFTYFTSFHLDFSFPSDALSSIFHHNTPTAPWPQLLCACMLTAATSTPLLSSSLFVPTTRIFHLLQTTHVPVCHTALSSVFLTTRVMIPSEDMPSANPTTSSPPDPWSLPRTCHLPPTPLPHDPHNHHDSHSPPTTMKPACSRHCLSLVLVLFDHFYTTTICACMFTACDNPPTSIYITLISSSLLQPHATHTSC